MKNHFFGYFKPSKSDIQNLWDSCLFVMDTNILFNLYRFSDSTRKEVMQVFEAVKERLWLPHHVAQEYFNNRLGVIVQQEKAYEDTIKTIQCLQKNLTNTRRHPFLSDKLMRKLSAVIAEVVDELQDNKNAHAKRIHKDEIQEAIGNIFNDRVGTHYSEDQLNEIYKKGEDRYARKVPPGYEDNFKEETSSSTAKYRKYGDLIIWLQIIDKANETKKGIIFINDDQKEDWYLNVNGKTLGPRPELIIEFHERTGQSFYMYHSDSFLEFAVKHLKQEITAASVQEIRDLGKEDTLKKDHISRFWIERALLRDRIRQNEKRMSDYLQKMEHLIERIDILQNMQTHPREYLASSEDENSNNLDQKLDSKRKIDIEVHYLRQQLDVIKRDYNMDQEKLAYLQSKIQNKMNENIVDGT